MICRIQSQPFPPAVLPLSGSATANEVTLRGSTADEGVEVTLTREELVGLLAMQDQVRQLREVEEPTPILVPGIG